VSVPTKEFGELAGRSRVSLVEVGGGEEYADLHR
jgi:hypothetical protein